MGDADHGHPPPPSPGHPVLTAVANGDTECLLQLIDHGADVLARDTTGENAFMLAVKNSDVESVTILVKAGANVNDIFPQDEGKTALILACERGDLPMVRALTYLGADQEFSLSTSHDLPIMAACRGGCISIVNHLVQSACNINVNNEAGETPLSVAFLNHHQSIVELLIGASVDINARNAMMDTPLITASRHGHLDLVRFLTERGAMVNAVNSYKFSPLMCAVQRNHPDIVHYLLSVGADVEMLNQYSENALIIASRLDAVTCGMLLKYGANPNKPDSCGNTPLMHAAYYGQKANVDLLVSYGVDIDVQNADGDSAIMCACKSRVGVDVTDCVRSLAEYGANLELTSDAGNKATVESILHGHVEAAKVLLESGCDINACITNRRSRMSSGLFGRKRVEKTTPVLMLTSAISAPDLVLCLLERGADPNTGDHCGNTPLMAAASANDCITLGYLLEAGADIETTNVEGLNAVMMAVEGEATDALRYLIEAGANVHAVCFSRPGGNQTALSIAVGISFDPAVAILLQAGCTVQSELRFSISHNAASTVQTLILNGALPTCPAVGKRFHHPLLKQSRTQLSPLDFAILGGRSNIAKFLMHIWFLNESDVQSVHGSNKLDLNSDHRDKDNVRTVEELRCGVHKGPWSLAMLSFVVISTSVGFGADRTRRVRALHIPQTFQRKLLFQDESSRLAVEKWDSLPFF